MRTVVARKAASIIAVFEIAAETLHMCANSI